MKIILIILALNETRIVIYRLYTWIQAIKKMEYLTIKMDKTMEVYTPNLGVTKK